MSEETSTEYVTADSFWSYYKPSLVYLIVAAAIPPAIGIFSWLPSIHTLVLFVAFLIYPTIRVFSVGPPSFNIKVLPETVLEPIYETGVSGHPILRGYNKVTDPWNIAANFGAGLVLRYGLCIMFFSGIEIFAQACHLIRAKRLWDRDGGLTHRSAVWSEYPALITMLAGVCLTLVLFWFASLLQYEPPVMSSATRAAYQSQFRSGKKFQLVSVSDGVPTGFQFGVRSKPAPREGKHSWEFSMRVSHESHPEGNVLYEGRVMYLLADDDDFPISISLRDRASAEKIAEGSDIQFPERLEFRLLRESSELIDYKGKWKLVPISAEISDPPSKDNGQ